MRGEVTAATFAYGHVEPFLLRSVAPRPARVNTGQREIGDGHSALIRKDKSMFVYNTISIGQKVLIYESIFGIICVYV